MTNNTNEIYTIGHFRLPLKMLFLDYDNNLSYSYHNIMSLALKSFTTENLFSNKDQLYTYPMVSVVVYFSCTSRPAV